MADDDTRLCIAVDTCAELAITRLSLIIPTIPPKNWNLPAIDMLNKRLIEACETRDAVEIALHERDRFPPGVEVIRA